MPVLFVIAGPNGIGKTTSSYDLVPINTPIINSDEIAKEVRRAGLASANTQEYSNSEAIRLMEEHRLQHHSFAIETNLADAETWKFLLEVQKTGYDLHVIFMSADNLEMLNNRIRKRTLLGDHFVRPDIVEQRYVTGLKLLDHYFDRPNRLQLIDNSKDIQLLVEVSHGQVLHHLESLPQWVTTYLGRHLQKQEKQETKIAELKDINEVRKRYQRSKQK